jgi:hypothetical protein
MGRESTDSGRHHRRPGVHHPDRLAAAVLLSARRREGEMKTSAIGSSDWLGGQGMQPSKQITAKKRPWTKDDVRRLRLLADSNISADSIAKFLGRSRASVKAKAHWLNLSLPQKAKISAPSERLRAARAAASAGAGAKGE